MANDSLLPTIPSHSLTRWELVPVQHGNIRQRNHVLLLLIQALICVEPATLTTNSGYLAKNTSTRIELSCATKTCSSQRENAFEVFRSTWKCNATLIFSPYSALVAPCTSASSPSQVFKGQLCHISKYAPCDSPDWSSARWMHKISDSKSKVKYRPTYFSYTPGLLTLVWYEIFSIPVSSLLFARLSGVAQGCET